jgi:hypothetical protein
MTEHSEEAADEIRFEREDAEAVGDPALAATEAEGSALEPEPVALPPQPEEPGDAGFAAGSPAAADYAGAEQAPSTGSAVGPVAGAFVGSFVLAKIIGRFGGGDD